MPDEPTNGAGDGGSSSARFRRGVERADQTTSDEPRRQPDRPVAGDRGPTPGPARPSPDGWRPATDGAEQGSPSNRPASGDEVPPRRSFVPPRQPPPGAAGGAGDQRPDRPAAPPRPGPTPPAPGEDPATPPILETAATAVATVAETAATVATTVAESAATAASTVAHKAREVQKARRSRATKPARRGRKVARIVRHIEPWSVLKISLLFYAALFVIICVASAILWNAARGTGTVDDVESFITDVGGFGRCEPIDGEGGAPTTTTTAPGATTTAPVDQIDPASPETTVAPPGVEEPPEDEDACREGERLVGEFKFEDGRIFQAFALGGVVLVLAGAAASVVLALLFNLMSDLTGGVRVTVLEEEPPARAASPAGSPRPRPRG